MFVILFFLLSSFFGNENCSLSLSFFLSFYLCYLYLSLCISLSLCSLHPLVLCFSTHHIWWDFFRRMVTKCNCFIWMMHFGIYTFSTVIYWFFFSLCCLCKLIFPLFFHLYVSLFLNTDWLCLFTSHLHPSPLTFPSHLCLLCVWRGSALDCFDWSLFCIRSLLIG